MHSPSNPTGLGRLTLPSGFLAVGDRRGRGGLGRKLRRRFTEGLRLRHDQRSPVPVERDSYVAAVMSADGANLFALSAGIAGLGAIFAINPGLGATLGTEIGGGLGAAVGIATAEPLPSYAPITIPASSLIPGFYDSWPPGYIAPPIGSLAPPPRPPS